MKIKNISRLLAFTMLLSTLNIHSFAGELSSDGRYETFEGDNIIIDNILEEDKVDVEVGGNTLVNLVSVNTDEYKTVTYHRNGMLNLGNASLFQNGKQYTIICEFSDIVGTASVCFNFNSGGGKPDIFVTPKEGLVKYTFTMPEEPLIKNNALVYAYYFSETDSCKIKNLRIIEGDWTDKKTPSYFKGIKSVGENEGNIVEFEHQNKNLFDMKNTTNKYVGNVVNGEVPLYGADFENKTSDFIKVKPNTTYTYSYSGYNNTNGLWTGWFYFKDKKMTSYIGERNVNLKSDTITFTTPSDANYILIGSRYLQQPNCKVQLEEGAVSTLYTDYNLEKETFELKEPLRGLPGGVRDRIVKRNGQWYIERNCAELELNGSEDWDIHANIQATDDTIYFASFNENVAGTLENTTLNAINDRFPSITREHFDINKGCEGIAAYAKWWSIGIKRSKLSEESIEGLKNYLSRNPIKTVYALSNPVYEPIDVNLEIYLFEGNNYLFTSSVIPSNIKLIVDRTSNRAQEAIELVKLNPTTENLSQARYWINLMKESTLKDKFQGEINTNTEIVDLAVEKKTTSANVDMYVKMKNSLSLSLDTNSITFEDFNASEDLEMKNAVNLMVSSSLPYKVSASLESEIYNADKTALIDKSVLNIKNNSDTSYKAFNNISEPLILLDNQIEGDNISHSLDLILKGGSTHKADVYKTTIRFEVEQK